MITVTPSAADYISDQLRQRGAGVGIRVGVRPSGCSGLAYALEFVDRQQAGDAVYTSVGVQVFVDKEHLVYLDGLELDYAIEGLNRGINIRNPNVDSECGCGESFTV